MDDLESLVKTTMGEIERLVNTRTLVGDPIVVGDNTLIPLISVGFGFGAGSNSGISTTKQKGEMSGAGSGGGAGIKPVAVIVINKDEVKVEPVMSGVSGAIEKITEMAPKAIEKVFEGRKEKKEEKKEK
ncbi:MAG: spore germination protein GerW family protein [Dehalococcoidales bacterium]|nr:spore germination protein GerW family protein [Dehalococcoidales bacterium]